MWSLTRAVSGAKVNGGEPRAASEHGVPPASGRAECLSVYGRSHGCGLPPENTMPDETQSAVPSDVAGYERFERVADAEYDRVNDFLQDRVHFTAREWALARLCADFRTKTGVEMTKIGEHLPELVPFMDDTYSSQAVYQARRSFTKKVRRSGATFLYGAFSGFLTADEVDDVAYEATEVAKFLLEVEGTPLDCDDELAVEERAREAMEAVHEASVKLRYDRCPHCGEELGRDADPA